MGGHVFEIVTKKEAAFSFGPDDIIERAGYEFNYCKELEPENVKKIAESFLEMMKKYGAKTGIDEGIPYFIMSDDVCCNYFKKQFERFTKLASQIKDVTDFSEANKMNEISNCIADQLGDFIYQDVLKCGDKWFRDAENNTKYYIGNVIYIHY